METIKPTELRIGNIIDKYGKPMIVDYGILQRIENGSVIFKPMILSEEWLLKFGIETDDITYYRDNLTLGFFANKGIRYLPTGSISNLGIELKYIHQLQNLYFALTGEELTQKAYEELS